LKTSITGVDCQVKQTEQPVSRDEVCLSTRLSGKRTNTWTHVQGISPKWSFYVPHT